MRIAALLLGCVLASPAFADETAVRLKDDPRRDLVAASCVMCHSLDYIPMNSPFLDRKGWDATVTKMIKAMGAQIKAEDVPQIVDYLAQHYGRQP